MLFYTLSECGETLFFRPHLKVPGATLLSPQARYSPRWCTQLGVEREKPESPGPRPTAAGLATLAQLSVLYLKVEARGLGSVGSWS